MKITIKRSKTHPFYFISNTLPDEVVRTLDDELSYYIANYEYMNSYKKGEFDGKIHLLRRTKRGDFYFPCGLLSRVEQVLRAFGIEYVVEEPEPPVFKHMNFEWRGYESTYSLFL